MRRWEAITLLLFMFAPSSVPEGKGEKGKGEKRRKWTLGRGGKRMGICGKGDVRLRSSLLFGGD